MVELVPDKMEDGLAERVTVGVPGKAELLVVLDPFPHAASIMLNKMIIANPLVTFKFCNFMIIPSLNFIFQMLSCYSRATSLHG